MKITDVLTEACIKVPLEATDKIAAISELIDVLHAAGKISDRQSVLETVIAREKMRSTGIGQGLAVPHGKVSTCDSLVMAVGKPTSPIDFASPDSRPCDLIVLLASPIDKTGPHIQALASISRLWMADRVREAVSATSTSTELFAVVKEFEA